MIRPSPVRAIGLIAFGGVLASGTARLLWNFGSLAAAQGQANFALMLGVSALAGLACMVQGTRVLLRRELLTIERRGDALLLPSAGARREIPLEEIEAVEEVVGLTRTVQVVLVGGERIAVDSDLYGGSARLASALEQLRD